MATPQVTSAAALIRALNPKLTAGQIKDILVQNARTSADIDGKKVPAPPELGGRILAIDQAFFKLINDQRENLGLVPFKDMDSALGLARINLVAESDPASPNDWKVTAQILGVEANGADVTLELQGEGAVGGNTKQHVSQSGSLTWSVTPKDTASIVVKRLDTGGCSRAYLAPPDLGEISIYPSSTRLRNGTSIQFSVHGIVSNQIIWAVTPGGGTITSDGIYTAPVPSDRDNGGTFEVTVSDATNPKRKASASVFVYYCEGSAACTFEEGY